MYTDTFTSIKLWYSDSFEFWVEVLVLQTLSIESVVLHLEIVVCADGVNIGSLGEREELLLGFVEVENILDAVEVLSNIILVFHDTKCSFNLIFVHF